MCYKPHTIAGEDPTNAAYTLRPHSKNAHDKAFMPPVRYRTNGGVAAAHERAAACQATPQCHACRREGAAHGCGAGTHACAGAALHNAA